MKLLALILPLAVAGAACDIRVDEGGIQGVRVIEGEAEDVWSRTYTLAADGRLEINGQNGEIDVRAAAGPQVEVRAERRVRAGSDEEAKQLLAKLEVREEVTPDSVRITTGGEESSWRPPGLGRRADARVQYRVRVPAGLTLTFRTENGGIRLENVDGRITATTTNGGITGAGVAGSLVAETVNGGIRMDLVSIAGDVTMTTTNGGVRVDLPADVKAALEASCVNGGIDIDDEFGVPQPDRRARTLSAALNGGGPKVTAATVNGGIRIRARGGRDTD
jgi:Putative adhesin